MSDIKKAKELLKRYSSARIPFIVINTMERDRTLEVLKEVAEELTISFFVHTMSKGIYDISSGKVLSEDKSIYSAIDYMSDQMKRRQNLTLVLTGIPDISSENADAKQLFDLVTHANETGGSIIVFTNGGVWNQLQRLGMTLKIDNPNEEETPSRPSRGAWCHRRSTSRTRSSRSPCSSRLPRHRGRARADNRFGAHRPTQQ